MISIKRYTISELLSLTKSPTYTKMDAVPISRHRAKSYVQNPRANPDDVVLYLAYFNGEMVGYRTLLPDIVSIGNTTQRVAWLSGNWVKPGFRRKGIASLLFNEANSDWNGNMLYTNYALESKAVYDKTGQFKLIQSAKGVRLYLRPCFWSILSNRGKVFRLLKPLWLTADFILTFINPLPLVARFLNVKGLQFENLHRADDELALIFEKATLTTPTQRKRQELDWIVDNPWLVSSPMGDRLGEKYFFSASPKRFEQYLVKVCRGDNLLGFVIVNITDGAVSVPYLHCQSADTKVFAKLVAKYAMAIGGNRLTVYHAEVADAIKRLMPFALLSRVQYRNYFATDALANRLKGVNFLEGDGDCAFV